MLPMLLSRWTQPSLSRLEERGREGWDTRVERGGILGRKWSKRGSERSGSSYRLTIASGRAYIYRVTQNCPLYVCLFVCLFVSLLGPSVLSSLADLPLTSMSLFLSICVCVLSVPFYFQSPVTCLPLLRPSLSFLPVSLYCVIVSMEIDRKDELLNWIRWTSEQDCHRSVTVSRLQTLKTGFTGFQH